MKVNTVVKTTLLVIGAVLVSSVFSLAADFDVPIKAKISESDVNAYAGANVNFGVVYTFQKGQIIQITGELYDWYKLALPEDMSCYVSNLYVDMLEDNDQLARVTADKLNVRNSPDINSSILGSLPGSTMVKIKSSQNDFYEIECAGDVNIWVKKDSVSLIPKEDK